jgi:hypothetical protein
MLLANPLGDVVRTDRNPNGVLKPALEVQFHPPARCLSRDFLPPILVRWRLTRPRPGSRTGFIRTGAGGRARQEAAGGRIDVSFQCRIGSMSRNTALVAGRRLSGYRGILVQKGYGRSRYEKRPARHRLGFFSEVSKQNAKSGQSGQGQQRYVPFRIHRGRRYS